MKPTRSNWLQIHIFSMPATNGEKEHDEGAAVRSKQDAVDRNGKPAQSQQPLMKHITSRLSSECY